MTLTTEGRGTHPLRVGNDVGVTGQYRAGRAGLASGRAGVRSLPAKQHAPKVRPMRWVPLAGLEPATCCLEDMSAPSSDVRRVRFSRVRSGAESGQSRAVRSGYAGGMTVRMTAHAFLGMSAPNRHPLATGSLDRRAERRGSGTPGRPAARPRRYLQLRAVAAC
jgi:hypothetical protein